MRVASSMPAARGWTQVPSPCGMSRRYCSMSSVKPMSASARSPALKYQSSVSTSTPSWSKRTYFFTRRLYDGVSARLPRVSGSPEFRPDLYRGTAHDYDRYRLPYPAELIDDLCTRVAADGSGRLLDLACGPGTATFA